MNTMAVEASNRNQPNPSENCIPMLESPNHISSMITQISSDNIIINSPSFIYIILHLSTIEALQRGGPFLFFGCKSFVCQPADQTVIG